MDTNIYNDNCQLTDKVLQNPVSVHGSVSQWSTVSVYPVDEKDSINGTIWYTLFH